MFVAKQFSSQIVNLFVFNIYIYFFNLLLAEQEYVRGLCDPELQKEERYPVDMHCIFAGARGLFLDRLIRDTSAEVLVPEPGRLRLLGRAEPVVMAQSRVQQFVALFQVISDHTHSFTHSLFACYKASHLLCSLHLLDSFDCKDYCINQSEA